MMNKKAQLRPYVISLVLVILASLFAFLFVGNFITTLNPSSEILESKYGINSSVSSLESRTSEFTSVSEDIRSQLGSAEPSPVQFIFLIFKGAFYIPLAFLSFVFTGITTLSTILFPTLAGTGFGSVMSITLGVLISVVTATIVLFIVKAIRTGEGER